MYKLKFEYTNDCGQTTRVEKEFDDWASGEFNTLLWEVKFSLLACGFCEELIDDYIQL